MTEIGIYQLAGIVIVLMVLVGIGLFSSRKVHGSGDFQGSSRQSSALVVTGAISGTIIGGSSTIGTAQLAYTYGVTACWFTVGSCAACLLLGLVYSGPLYKNSEPTSSGIIRKEFGHFAGTLSSGINAGGMFIALVAQMVSAVAVWRVIFPAMTRWEALLLTIALIAAYVVFGGVRGVGLIGVFKLALLYAAVFGGGCLALWKFGGFRPIFSCPVFRSENYFFPLARGWSTDIGSALSAMFGCLSSQSYVQAIRSGKTAASSRRGAVISALMIPLIGLGAMLIGLYMRVSCPDLLSDNLALPYFLAANTPAIFCGVCLGAILITVIGAAAGIALGIMSIINGDFIRILDEKKGLLVSRFGIVALLAAAAAISCAGEGAILDYSFLGLALRAVSCVIAYTAALFWPGKCGRRTMLTVMTAGPLTILLCKYFNCPIDALMMGFAVSFVILGAAFLFQQVRKRFVHGI